MQTTEQPKRSWVALKFEIEPEQEDLAGWLLIHLGAQGCEFSLAQPALPSSSKPFAPALSHSDSGKVQVEATFAQGNAGNEQIEKVKATLEEYGLGACLQSLKVRTVVEEDWLAKWKEGYEPFPVGNKFLICPPWLQKNLTVSDLVDRHLLLIEPGMAFGTGLHATTRYCLTQIESAILGEEILDVGTGSGVLAMACAKLNPQARILAVDTADDAIRVCQANLQLNSVGKNIELVHGSTEVVGNQVFNTILSNMTYEDIVALIPEYLRLLKPGGTIICAGILTEKLPLLKDFVKDKPLKIVNIESEGMWTGVTLRHSSGS
jgi:ribosomal protein L11 methyltransferase